MIIITKDKQFNYNSNNNNHYFAYTIYILRYGRIVYHNNKKNTYDILTIITANCCSAIDKVNVYVHRKASPHDMSMIKKKIVTRVMCWSYVTYCRNV